MLKHSKKSAGEVIFKATLFVDSFMVFSRRRLLLLAASNLSRKRTHSSSAAAQKMTKRSPGNTNPAIPKTHCCFYLPKKERNTIDLFGFQDSKEQNLRQSFDLQFFNGLKLREKFLPQCPADFFLFKPSLEDLPWLFGAPQLLRVFHDLISC